LRQERILEKTKSNTITFQSYKDEKKEITKLNNDTYWTIQIVTITAGLNAIIFVLMMWYWHYFYVITNDTFTYKDMIFFDDKMENIIEAVDKDVICVHINARLGLTMEGFRLGYNYWLEEENEKIEFSATGQISPNELQTSHPAP
jgi:hypothetical protein